MLSATSKRLVGSLQMLRKALQPTQISKAFQLQYVCGFQFCVSRPAPTSTQLKKDEEEQLPYLELVRDFLEPKEFYEMLSKNGIQFYTGVPDSLLKDFCAYVTDNHPKEHHIIAANEGSALSLAAGYHLATNRVPLVYLQNSGLGNMINPLMSLTHQKVFGIPMILLIGWRGEPGKKDEPQHMFQGKAMNGMITEMGIPFEVLPDFIDGAKEVLENAVYNAIKRKTPFALIVKRQTFVKYSLKNKVKSDLPMTREKAISVMLPLFGDHDAVVATTGFMSRELYELREINRQKHDHDFYCVGSMGHSSSIAAGIALIKRSRKVWCLDGDGAAIMHLGSMTQVGQLGLKNFKHVIVNNFCHDSVGAQPTAANSIDFTKIALGCGYSNAWKVDNEADLIESIKKIREMDGPVMLEVLIRPGARKDLGRPTQKPIENKESFMSFLNL